MLYLLKVIVCVLLIVFQSPAMAIEIKPFVSVSFIKINSSDWLNPDYTKRQYVKPRSGATIKAGISIVEENLSVDINMFHLSNPTNGTIGDFKEGDAGINGIEWGVRYVF
jgi:hypothetical protein